MPVGRRNIRRIFPSAYAFRDNTCTVEHEMLRYDSLLLVLILGLEFLPGANASAVTVTITPSTQAVLQSTLASYTVGISSGAKNAYRLTLSGLVAGTPYSFSSNPVSHGGNTNLSIDTSSTPLYCPGTYPFTVTATNSTSMPTPGAPGDSSSASATLTVVQVGPPLGVTVAANKATYRIGDTVTITLTANRPGEGVLTITGPSGSPSTFPYTFYDPSYAITKTFTVNTVGRYNVNFQADDFCSGFSSASTTFDASSSTTATSSTSNLIATTSTTSTLITSQTVTSTEAVPSTMTTTVQKTSSATSTRVETTTQVTQATAMLVLLANPLAEATLSFLTLGAVASIVIFLTRTQRKRSSVCRQCGFTNPQFVESFCVKCGKPLKRRT